MQRAIDIAKPSTYFLHSNMPFLDIFHGIKMQKVKIYVKWSYSKAKFSDLCLILSHGPPLYIESRIATV